ncbi:lytic transglycosylase [Erwinia sp. OLTSP20]|uniref:lytic transglycosylase domain-containing protein n=1 Tax=unclassified Erwinia TaxID=2622719 RepID=UPI000C1A6E86|nr:MULTISPECIES: lytic transglycosylase domain-containing protein [unclassified Erwinia]PIJ48963.1 lytic transglycosylase [Erwinia sp. OAMSP11]PIJ74617.1 lytic transglycosylase [Erwinia sp. OLSSP12]PIJ79648.1 lytic transglycosylase [Erwinia sp. OLCASP19]PIJ80433.1 lytic transglycosylase [Erwinia sp. OLMTSP26]PIJ82548.1 lytic transglycosylase [Erwinia sp. OLMDSP33]
MAGNQLPVLTLDFDDEKIKALHEIADKFKAAIAVGPGGFPVPALTARPPAKKPEEQTGKKPDASGFDKFMKGLNKEAQGTLKTFTLINKTLGATTSTLKGLFATTISWGTKIAALSVAGPFGYGLVARHVADQYRTAQGLNVTSGQMQAANNVYGTRISNTSNIMQALAGVQNDPNNPQYAGIMSLGINPQAGAAENMPKLLTGVSRLLQQYKGTGVSQSVLKGYGLDGVIDVATANQILANSDRLPQLNKQFAEQSQVLDRDMGSGTQQKYQDVTAKFEYNADRIGNSFLKALAKLSGPIGKISDNLTASIEKFLNGKNGKAVFDTLASGLQKLGDWLGGDSFQTDLKTFADCVKAIVTALGQAIKWIAGNVPGVDLSGAGKGPDQVNPILKMYGDEYLNGKLPGSNPATGKYTGIWSDKNIFDKNGLGYHMPGSQLASLKTRFDKVAQDNQLPAGLLGAVAMKESSGNPLAYNKKSGAAGLFQFTTPTAAGYGLSTMERFDPEKSVDAAGKYFRDNLNRYGGDIAKALAQYNGGNIAVSKDGNLNLKKETVDYLLNILPKVQGAVEQHPGILQQLSDASSTLGKGSVSDRATINLQVNEKPGSDIQAQVQGIYITPR